MVSLAQLDALDAGDDARLEGQALRGPRAVALEKLRTGGERDDLVCLQVEVCLRG